VLGAKFDTKFSTEENSMAFSISEDIRPITDLKKHTREVLEQARTTGRPIILTTNGRADAVLLDARTYEKHLKATNLARLLGQAESDIAAGRTRPVRSFLREFKNANKISR
jgi:prevent-host-death family protein